MLYVLLQVIDYMRAAVNFVAFSAVVVVALLMFSRWVLLKAQPFGRLSQVVRGWTDPMIWPITQSLPAPNSLGIAPLFVILGTLLAAFFLKWISNDVLLALEGVVRALLNVAFLQVIGWLFYGAISVFLVLILARIIVSWMPFFRNGRMIWTLYSLTEPVMAPFRRLIPPLGMFDLSPILLILLLNFAKGAVLVVFGLSTT
jgi:YggT family protein